MSKFKLKATILDKRGRVLSVGFNSYTTTHTHQAKLAKQAGRPGAIYLHAEISAIVKCRRLDKAHTIIVERYGKNGQPLLAKPCSICQLAIEQAGIENVEYTNGTWI